MERAYDDAQGVTARFNRNILERINRELNGHFPLEAFRHRVTTDQITAYVRGGVRTTSSLASETCVPCRGGTPVLVQRGPR